MKKIEMIFHTGEVAGHLDLQEQKERYKRIFGVTLSDQEVVDLMNDNGSYYGYRLVDEDPSISKLEDTINNSIGKLDNLLQKAKTMPMHPTPQVPKITAPKVPEVKVPSAPKPRSPGAIKTRTPKSAKTGSGKGRGYGRGGTKPSHKYLARTGGPGSYSYSYQGEGKKPKGSGEAEKIPQQRDLREVLAHKEKRIQIFQKEGQRFGVSIEGIPFKGDFENADEARSVAKRVIEDEAKQSLKQVKPKRTISVKFKAGMDYIDEIKSRHMVSQKDIDDFEFKAAKSEPANTVHYAMKDGKIIGAIGYSPSFKPGEYLVKYIKTDPTHKDKAVNSALLRHAAEGLLEFAKDNKFPQFLRAGHSFAAMTSEEARAWVDLRKYYGREFVTEDPEANRMEFHTTSTKALDLAPFSDYDSVRPYNKDMLQDAAEVYNRFQKGNYQEIMNGECGIKGFVNVKGKEYFVKSEKGENIHADKNQPFTASEVSYTNSVNQVFPELASYFPRKFKLSEDTFMQEKIERHPYSGEVDTEPEEDEEGESRHMTVKKKLLLKYVKSHPQDMCKLGIVNFVMGNKDRHDGNVVMNDKGDLKLIDEGLAFCSDYTLQRAPCYVRAMAPNLKVDYDPLINMLSDQNKEAVTRELQESNIHPQEIDAFHKRWDHAKELLQLKKEKDAPVVDLFTHMFQPSRYFDYLSLKETYAKMGKPFHPLTFDPLGSMEDED